MNELNINFYVDKVLRIAFFTGPIAFVSMIFVLPISTIVLNSYYLVILLFCLVALSAVLMFSYSVLVLKKIYSKSNKKLFLLGCVYVVFLNALAGYFLYYRLEQESEGISNQTFRI